MHNNNAFKNWYSFLIIVSNINNGQEPRLFASDVINNWQVNYYCSKMQNPSVNYYKSVENNALSRKWTKEVCYMLLAIIHHRSS